MRRRLALPFGILVAGEVLLLSLAAAAAPELGDFGSPSGIPALLADEETSWFMVGGAAALLSVMGFLGYTSRAVFARDDQPLKADIIHRIGEQRFQNVADRAPVLLWMADAEGRCRFANQSLLDFTGLSLADVLGDDWIAAVHPNDLEQLLCDIRIGLSRREAFLLRCRLRRADGAFRWGQIQGAPQMMPDGAFAGYVGSFTDIHDHWIGERYSELLRRLDGNVIRGTSRDEILNLICREALDLFQMLLVRVVRVEPGGKASLVAQICGNAALVELAPKAVAGETGFPLAIRAVREQRGIVVEAESLADSAWGGVIERFDVAGFFAVPLVESDGGHLVLVAATPRMAGFDRDTMRHLEDLAVHGGLALRMAEDQRQIRLQAAAMASAVNAIFITGAAGTIEWMNDAFTRQSGYSRQEALGRNPRFLHSGEHDESFFRNMLSTVRAGRVWRGEVVERRKDGHLYTVVQTVTPIRDALGMVTHYVVIHEDVTAQKRQEERIRFLANFDALTGLPNRALFRDRLQQAVAAAREAGGMVAVHVFDIHRFSHVNDTLGHDVGDKALTALSNRLKNLLRQDDTLGRLGGDTFAVVQVGLTEAEHASQLAQTLIEGASKPLQVSGQEIHLEINVGIALYPSDSEDPEHLLQDADLAMYQAVRQSPSTYRLFAHEMNAEAAALVEMRRDLRHALPRGELMLHYQPQADLGTGAITGCEALIRWNHPERGLVPPGAFIPLAEDSGLIVPIGGWILRAACAQMKAWGDAGMSVGRVGINLSPLQFDQPGLVAEIAEVLEAAELPPERIEIELTEGMLMRDPDAAAATLRELNELGVSLALDDFGTGYSSFSYLKRFPVHRLKIDRSFVKDLAQDVNDAAIVRAIIGVGHSLGLTVIAEGVETEEQVDYLRAAGCDEIQGYLIGRPMSAEAFGGMLAERDRIVMKPLAAW